MMHSLQALEIREWQIEHALLFAPSIVKWFACGSVDNLKYILRAGMAMADSILLGRNSCYALQ